MTLGAQMLNFIGSGTPGASSGLTLPAWASSLLGLNSPAELYAAMMTGNTVFDRIIERFNLRKLYNENKIESTRKELGKKAKIAARKMG